MKTLSTIVMTTALALGTIAATEVPASADYFSSYGSYGGYGSFTTFSGVPGGNPDISYIFHPFRAHPRPNYAYPYSYAGGDHVQRCLARYRTYNPATDLYYKHPGVAARCRL